MSTTLTVNGVGYSFPQTGEDNWGDNVTNWASAVTSGMLQKSGGTFTLTAEVDFGATYGLKSAYLKSRATNPASAGQIRLGNAETIKWRNAANSGDIALTVSASDVLTFNSLPVSALALGSADTVLRMNSGGTAQEYSKLVNANIDSAAAIDYSKLNLGTSIVNADINASAAIAYSKLNLSGSIVNADINSSAAIAYSKLNLSTSIVNADVSGSAAIAYSKLNLSSSIVNADISGSAAIAYSKLNLATSIVNADISGSAAIAYSKLSLGTSIVNADISGSAAIAYSKLSLSNSIVLADLASAIKSGSGSALVSTSGASFTLADFDGGAASNTSRITLPKASKASLDALTRKEATLCYASDEDKVYVDTGSTLVELAQAATTVTSGTYSPTATIVSGMSAGSITMRTAKYIRVGSIVHIAGEIDGTNPNGTGLVTIRITLPVASNFSSANDASGTVAGGQGTNLRHAGYAQADTTNDEINLIYATNDNSSSYDNIGYSVMYQII